jgi:uncharacterized tellurite resistance protein B-like protein
MKTESKINAWELEHFLSYMYLTIGYADGVLLDEEVEVSKKKLRNFLQQLKPSQYVNADKVLGEVLSEIKMHSNAEKMETIRDLSSKFEFSPDLKTEIVSDLTDIVCVDDVVDAEEHKTLAYIRSVIA